MKSIDEISDRAWAVLLALMLNASSGLMYMAGQTTTRAMAPGVGYWLRFGRAVDGADSSRLMAIAAARGPNTNATK